MYGLIDCNNFYISCERAFNPALTGKPVVVLSNNDGCAIARSNEAKELGLKMGTPYFQMAELIEQHRVKVFSSNYTLYGDMSARVMGTLGHFVEGVEVYSIDEAFLNLTGYEMVYPNLTGFARTVRQTIDRWTRIPVSVGIAPTKTLCKVANYYAKRQAEHGGVLMLDTPDKIQSLLADYDVLNLWGIGWRYAGMLKRNEIRTAAQLAALPDDWINENMTVNGLRLAYELRGRPCKMLELDTEPKKAICMAPSFGRLIPDLTTITEALTTHIGRVAEKLRKQHCAARALTVFLHTNRFKRSQNGELAKQYYNSRTVELPHATSNTAELMGYAYQKVGVILTDLVPDSFEQTHLFTASPDKRMAALSDVVDKLNHRHGRDKVRLAGAGFDPSWHHKRQFLSPAYTTNWKDILIVK